MTKFAVLGLMLLAFTSGALIAPASAPEASPSLLVAQSLIGLGTGISVIVLCVWGFLDIFAS